jgi:hypothetical protein
VTALAGIPVTFVRGNTLALGLAGGAIAAIGLVVYAAAPWRPARTRAGAELALRAAGFEMSLRTAEAQRQRFAEEERLSEDYLPWRSRSDSWSNGAAALGSSTDPATSRRLPLRSFRCKRDCWVWFGSSKGPRRRPARRRHRTAFTRPLGLGSRRLVPQYVWCVRQLGALRRSAEAEKSQTNERVPTSVYRPFCDDNVLVLVALTS